MSTKDTLKAADTLLKTFGPVVEALPAIITALSEKSSVEQSIAELERAYERLVAKYNEKVADFDKADAAERVRMDARRAELNALEETAKAALADLAKKNRDMGTKINARQKELGQMQTTFAQEVAAYKELKTAEIEAAKAAAAAKIEEFNLAAAEAQKKHDDIVKKLEALKAKL